ncbi:MAG: substrate-binding domain-containing protein [Succinivibrio sp.]|nr:substrate-binding domain-containing protein [Succinivibrio sp.]
MLSIRFGVACAVAALSTLAQAELAVCAVPQLYAVLEGLHDHTALEYQVNYATSADLYSKLVNKHLTCDLLLSDEEKLPILLTRADLTDPYSFKALFRAPLILWSPDPDLIQSSYNAPTEAKISSLALADPRLTPVGFASHKVFNRDLAAVKRHIQSRVYTSEHEYLVYSMVKEGLVQCGLISKPLALSASGRLEGSYWEVPRSSAPDLLYYIIKAKAPQEPEAAETFYQLLLDSANLNPLLIDSGFAPLDAD